MRISNTKYDIKLWFTALAFTSATFLLALTLAPDMSNHASATGQSADLTLGIDSPVKLSMALEEYNGTGFDPSKEISITTEGTDPAFGISRITASTNNPTGYTLSYSDADSDTSLTLIKDGEYDHAAPSISSTDSTPKEASSLEPNTWGHSRTTSSYPDPPGYNWLWYSGIPTSPTTFYSGAESGQKYHFFVTAAKIASDFPSGTYSDEVVFSIVANPAPVARDFFTTNYIQDFTKEVCDSVKAPASSITNVTAYHGYDYSDNGITANIVPSTYAIDKRDGQKYIVRKLADGNCWMTDNLRYGSNPDGSVREFLPSDASLSDNINAEIMSNLTSSHISTTNNDAGFFEDSSDFYTLPYISISGANDIAGFWDQAKYGVLYNYCAATGGTGCTGTNESPEPTGSICPKNWTMPAIDNQPTGDKDSAITDGSVKTIDNLLNAQGILNTYVQKIRDDPINFTLSGNYASGSLDNRNITGRIWATNQHSALYAHTLYVHGSSISKDQSRRRVGIPVRCVQSGN